MSDECKKTDIPALDDQIAKQMLENIFEACDMESNKIPLEVLTSYSNYRRERFALQRLVLVVIMVLFFLLPVLFIAPKISIRELPATISADSGAEHGASRFRRAGNRRFRRSGL